MSNSEKIKSAMARNIKTIRKRPSIGRAAEHMSVEVSSSGSCTIKDGDNRLVINMPEAYGGPGGTPSPGFFARAALGSCLAMGYYTYAAVLDVPVNHISIDIHDEYDMSGNLGIDKSIPPSYTSMRYVINIDSPAPRTKIEELINTSDELDSIRDVFANGISLQRELNIINSEAVV